MAQKRKADNIDNVAGDAFSTIHIAVKCYNQVRQIISDYVNVHFHRYNVTNFFALATETRDEIFQHLNNVDMIMLKHAFDHKNLTLRERVYVGVTDISILSRVLPSDHPGIWLCRAATHHDHVVMDFVLNTYAFNPNETKIIVDHLSPKARLDELKKLAPKIPEFKQGLIKADRRNAVLKLYKVYNNDIIDAGNYEWSSNIVYTGGDVDCEKLLQQDWLDLLQAHLECQPMETIDKFRTTCMERIRSTPLDYNAYVNGLFTCDIVTPSTLKVTNVNVFKLLHAFGLNMDLDTLIRSVANIPDYKWTPHCVYGSNKLGITSDDVEWLQHAFPQLPHRVLALGVDNLVANFVQRGLQLNDAHVRRCIGLKYTKTLTNIRLTTDQFVYVFRTRDKTLVDAIFPQLTQDILDAIYNDSYWTMFEYVMTKGLYYRNILSIVTPSLVTPDILMKAAWYGCSFPTRIVDMLWTHRNERTDAREMIQFCIRNGAKIDKANIELVKFIG